MPSFCPEKTITWLPQFVFGQGEEGPPSLEYIKAKDLFPQKELVKEDESLQVRPQNHCSRPQAHPLWLPVQPWASECGTWPDYEVIINAGAAQEHSPAAPWWIPGRHCVVLHPVTAKIWLQDSQLSRLGVKHRRRERDKERDVYHHSAPFICVSSEEKVNYAAWWVPKLLYLQRLQLRPTLNWAV